MFNTSKAPFDNLDGPPGRGTRRSTATTLNQVARPGLSSRMASGPFAPGDTGYLEDAGFPEFDLDEAEELVGQYEEETGRPLEFTDHRHRPAPRTPVTAQFHPGAARRRSGIEVQIKPDRAGRPDQHRPRRRLAGPALAEPSRRRPRHPVRLVEERLAGQLRQDRRPGDERAAGRGPWPSPTRTPAREIYEDINRLFAEQALQRLVQLVAAGRSAPQPDVYGVFGPDLPDGSAPVPRPGHRPPGQRACGSQQ